LHHYQAGRNAYILRDFTQAIARFKLAQVIEPTNQAVHIHLERTYKYQQIPPPKSWDGVWTIITK
jgi:adenylate cyclase